MATQRRRLIAEHAVGVSRRPTLPCSACRPAPDHDWVRRRLTPQPAHTHDTPLRLRNAVGNGLPCTYIACTDPPLASIAPSHRWVRDRPGWAWLEVATGHDATVTAPAELTRQLAAIP